MPRQSSTGKFIFSASEVAEFIVCPESWFHQKMNINPKQELNIKDNAKSIEGQVLHDRWAIDYAHGLSINRMLRIVAALVAAATLILLIQYG
jgi:hypothetical protein